jgi:hypothetical protein
LRCVRIDAFLFFTLRCSHSCFIHWHIVSLIGCSASPGGNCRVSRYDAIIPITHSFHPLPDRDRSRIASGLWVRRLPPVVVTLLLILRVTVSGDTRNVREKPRLQDLVLLRGSIQAAWLQTWRS